MIKNTVPYEVEFRCHFNGTGEAYSRLPFLRASLHRKFAWNGIIYGKELFQSGCLLRTAEVLEGEHTRNYITWKGRDTGRFANIRQELAEDITTGITDSSILPLLGGRKSISSKEEIIHEIEQLGYHRFMSWEGIDITGYYKPLKLNMKLMTCKILKWPVIVEFEKMAKNEDEAVHAEVELEEISKRFQLEDYVFRQEPPTLLYEVTFSTSTK